MTYNVFGGMLNLAQSINPQFGSYLWGKTVGSSQNVCHKYIFGQGSWD